MELTKLRVDTAIFPYLANYWPRLYPAISLLLASIAQSTNLVHIRNHEQYHAGDKQQQVGIMSVTTHDEFCRAVVHWR